MMAAGEIALIDLEKELGKLWRPSQGNKQLRASLFNLVIYAEERYEANDYSRVVKSVVSKFPCRVFLITKGEGLKTSLSSYKLSDGIFCEIIKIEVSAELHERVPYIILPHILPDLPLYLLWTKDPGKEREILPILEKYASRVIFEVETYADLQKTSLNILETMKKFSLEVGDLHWSAQKGWRQIFASVFDRREEIEKLQTSKRIRVIYHGSEDHVRSAAYFQAWLSSRLNWRFHTIDKAEGNVRITYLNGTSEVAFLLIPDEDIESQLPTGALLSIEIKTERDAGEYVFRRATEKRQVFYQYCDQNECGLPIALFLGGMTEGQEIIDEIFYPTNSRGYKAMLENLAKIPWGRM